MAKLQTLLKPRENDRSPKIRPDIHAGQNDGSVLSLTGFFL